MSIAVVWIAALVAMPRKPLSHDDVQELVYFHLLGRQHRVVLLAIIVTVLGLLALVLSMPSSLAARGNNAPQRQQICVNISGSPPTCYTPQPGGEWLEEEWQADGTWRVIGMSSVVPRLPGEKDDDP
jgi:hypothetical protein